MEKKEKFVDDNQMEYFNDVWMRQFLPINLARDKVTQFEKECRQTRYLIWNDIKTSKLHFDGIDFINTRSVAVRNKKYR